jgi:beta-galactosidase
VLSCSSIYGDFYTLGKDSIDSIGNNVTITFEGLDFGRKGIRRLVICGRTLMDMNTIIVCFKSAGNEVKQLAEFFYSPEFTEREFSMDNITGIQTVSFLFLPGCDFDFKWFRFIC